MEPNTILLSYSQIRNVNFSAGLQKLVNHSGFAGREAYHIGRIIDKARTFETECIERENKIHLKYARKNEDGTRYIPEGKHQAYFEVAEENQKDHDEECESLLEESITIDKYKIPFAWVDKVGLTPAQMVALEPLLDMEEKDNVLQMVKEPVQTGPGTQPTT